jgi:hypothetical protein
MESSPKSGIAKNIETIRKARKLAITTNIENMSCEKGFIVRKAVNAILFLISGKDKRMIDRIY